ncbi:GAF domain-containing protein [Okeania sp. SIO1I7]|uniref:GAF domain-containing sensor histidine kinase n=1 Tax=Okeania sp. SIO1I7 TaxID=2607772 RepID=UPI0013F94430|nr:GAF domain-containing protein [Okeania sp. SIO1I7]NET26584.1 GAF domain-containing protein [Okeania sp. SIO1I7]
MSVENQEYKKKLATAIARIPASLDQETTFKTTVTEVRQLINADRVTLLRFYPQLNWQGEFLCEDVADDWNSILGERVEHWPFGEELAVYNTEGYIETVTDIEQAKLSESEAKIFQQFQVQAHLVVPILTKVDNTKDATTLTKPELWGLLCIHQCSRPREWQDVEIELAQTMAQNLGVVIKNTDLLEAAHYQVQQQKALARVIKRIRTPLDLEEIFKITATEVRQLLKADRVGVFRFYPERDWEGELVSEDVGTEWNSALAVKVYDHCFGEQFAVYYQEGRVQAVADIYQAGLSDCHAEILGQFQVRANLVVPLLKGAGTEILPELWGLLCIHQCSSPRHWQEYEIEFVQQIADHFGVALQQEDALIQLEKQAAQLAISRQKEKLAERQKIVGELFDKIRRSFNIETIFAAATEEVRKLLQAERVAIYQFLPDWSGEFVAESFAEGWTPLVGVQPIIEDTFLQETQGGRYVNNETFAVDDIYQVGHDECYVQLLEQFEARSYALVPILPGEKLWGLLAAYQNSAPRHWQKDEVDLLAQIAAQLGVALQQAEYFQKVQEQSVQLAKAAEQEKSAEREKTLAAIVDKMRRSLDIKTIFQTTTQEVQQLLDVDRVAIFRFNDDWSGEFMAESVAEGWVQLIQEQKENPKVPANVSKCSLRDLPNSLTDTYLQETQGGDFTKGVVYRTCNDIYNSGFSDCYIETLESYQARAYAIVAIYQGKKLWGLLAAFQNSAPREWETAEVELLTQIGVQLGVALQQAEYVKQVKTQAAELAKATERQKALSITIDRIRQSLDINAIFQTTTQEVRQLLEVERVAIYRFYPDWSGEFVADSMIDEWTPIVQTPLAINPVISKLTHAGTLPRNETFVPILQGDQLWGLLVAYQNSSPRYWQDEEINLLAQVGVQLGIALQQAELLEKTRTQTEELTKTLQELKQTQVQMIQGEKMASLGQLVAGIAHEINNPVNFISGNLTHVDEYAQSLLTLMKLYHQHYLEPVSEIQDFSEDIDLEFIIKDLPKMIDSMKMGAERIRQLVLSLRTFSRLDESKKKEVDLHAGIDSTLLILQHRLKLKPELPQITIVKNYGDLPLVPCYAAPINQVFMNLLSNAIDVLEEKLETDKFFIPTITITTEINPDNPDTVLIKIADNGLGITQEAKDKIFDLFFTTKEVGKGTGLGLSISYEIIVQKHGGQLFCNSQLGQGTEFIIQIPIHPVIE